MPSSAVNSDGYADAIAQNSNTGAYGSNYDPHVVDAYAEHLTEVNEVKEVIASEDIRNNQGMLLIKKGQPISKDMIERIVQFKLVRPIESSIDIADALTPERILEDIENLISESLRAPYARYQLKNEIKHCCTELFRYPILVQKLTVLSLQMPREYSKALCVCCVGLLIAMRMQMNHDERANLFIAALVHDIGMLHIPRDIVDKKGDLSPEEWRAIQGHVVIGQQILKQIKGLPPSIARAVLEHHEFCDGTGYPLGRFGAELSRHGQIVGLLDSVFAICTNKLIPQRIGTNRLLPILQINAHIYHQDVCNAMLQLLRDLELPETHWIEPGGIDKFVNELIDRATLLENYYCSLAQIVKALPADHAQHHVRASRALFDHLDTLLRRSGVLDEGYFSELQRASIDDASARNDAENTHLMLQELSWQLQRLTRTLHAAVDDIRQPLPKMQTAELRASLAQLPALKSGNK